MKRLVILAVLLLVSSAIAVQAADDTWAEGKDWEYNCTTLTQFVEAVENPDADIAEISALPFVKQGKTLMTLGSYITTATIAGFREDSTAALTQTDLFGEALTVCGANAEDSAETSSGDTFKVSATGNANLRSCAGTDCSIVGQATAGEQFTVVGVEGDWYQIDYQGQTAYIASFLAMRAPDNVISTDETFVDERTGCILVFDIKRGDADMGIILTGGRKNDIVVDLYRPNETKALTVEGQLDKTFIDTGDPYILQYYSWNVGWPSGIYNLELSLDDNTTKVAWEMKERGDYKISVMCE
ncbi:MAG TPA: SH3 domain-containing protein [Phototrophicaceae bacterium]|nr:SH3 domain-containing protein [Phototrophicaceae bacterium]